MIKKVIAAVFAGLVVVSFANTSSVNCDDVSGNYKYKIVCKAPDPFQLNLATTHSATTIITQSTVYPANTEYHTMVRAEIRYNNRVIINTNKLDKLKGKEDKDNKIEVKKKIKHSEFKNTFHDTTLGGVGKNYSAKHTFTDKKSQTITGTRYIP